MTGLFVTGSGTGIGKTLFTVCLASQLAAAGREVRILKPVISGFDGDDPGMSDTAQLLRAVGRRVDEDSIAEVSPWRFAAPLSPDMAAAREGRQIDIDEVITYCRETLGRATRADAAVLIEGVGGVLVPLTENATVADWIAALDIPAVVLSGSYLGALSHTLTAVEALRSRNIPVAGVVVSESPVSPVPLAETAATLGRFCGEIPVVTLPRMTDTDRMRAKLDLTSLV